MASISENSPPHSQPDEAGHNLAEYTVSELAAALKREVEGAFPRVRVRGEVSQPKTYPSGHCYFTLKDEKSVIRAIAWSGVLRRLAVKPEEGLEVIVSGRLMVQTERSQYALVIDSLEMAGQGALLKQLEERKKKLQAEGLFDAARKRPIPWLPGVIGVVTSPQGAVIRDILHRLADRFPRHVLVWPVAVQGERAAGEVAAAIAGFNRLAPGGKVPRPDLIIVARGGGSLEDLWAFNEEIVVRAAAASQIPLISAVGHETDTTLIDFASDRRAPTPTAAAEMAVPVRAELRAQTLERGQRLIRATERQFNQHRLQVQAASAGLGDPTRLIEERMQRLDDRGERLAQSMRGLLQGVAERIGRAGIGLRSPQAQLDRKQDQLTSEWRALAAGLRRFAGETRLTLNRLSDRAGEAHRRAGAAMVHRLREHGAKVASYDSLLQSLSFRKVLERGYAVVWDEAGAPLQRAAAARSGAAIAIEFADAKIAARIEGKPAPSAPPRKPPAKPSGGQGSLL